MSECQGAQPIVSWPLGNLRSFCHKPWAIVSWAPCRCRVRWLYHRVLFLRACNIGSIFVMPKATLSWHPSCLSCPSSLHHKKPKVLCSRLGWVMTDDLEHVTTHILLKVWRGPFHVTIPVWHIATKNCVSWVWANGKWAATQFTSLFILDHVGDSLLVS
jgi:hypothetical protein